MTMTITVLWNVILCNFYQTTVSAQGTVLFGVSAVKLTVVRIDIFTAWP